MPLDRIATWLAILALLAAPVAGQSRASIAGGAVTLEVPEGLRELSGEELALKYPHPTHAPQHAFASGDMGVSIAVTFSPARVAPAQLLQLKATLEQAMPKLNPSIRWIRREVVEIDGRSWIHFEFTSQAVDTQIHNHAYMTSFRGRMLGVNFNSTEAQYPANETALLRSSRSIRLRS